MVLFQWERKFLIMSMSKMRMKILGSTQKITVLIRAALTKTHMGLAVLDGFYKMKILTICIARIFPGTAIINVSKRMENCGLPAEEFEEMNQLIKTTFCDIETMYSRLILNIGLKLGGTV